MKMSALNIEGIQIYFRIPKCILYILKDQRHVRKSIWGHREHIGQVYFGFSLCSVEGKDRKLEKQKKLDADKRR